MSIQNDSRKSLGGSDWDLELDVDQVGSSLPVRGGRDPLRVFLDWLSIVIILCTVCVLPWLLGSVLPIAQWILTVGACLALGCCVVGQLLKSGSGRIIPIPALLLLGMSGIGCLQLLPHSSPPTHAMEHAVFAEHRFALAEWKDQQASGSFNKGQSTAKDSVLTEPTSYASSTSPADTRLAVAQWLSLSMLLLVSFQTITTQTRLALVLGVLVLNACMLTIVAMLQMFGDGSMIVGGTWIVSNTSPFGPFVNPNNAAGWLNIHMAAALGLLVILWGRATTSRYSQRLGSDSWKDQLWNNLASVQERVAQLNNYQIVSLACLAVIIAGIACTLSRAGIVAAIVALAGCSAVRLKWQQALLMLLPLVLILGIAISFLTLLDLDTLVVNELRTLKDPVSETTGRLLHWSDSLVAVLDFPMFGSGLNAYQYSTLPYQRHAFRAWFRNADNQFVEVLVEAGFVGLCLFCAVGLLGLIAAVRLSKSVNRSTADKSSLGHTRVWRLALSLTCTAMVASQVVAAGFDFGIGLPANAAVFVVLLGACLVPFSWKTGHDSSIHHEDDATADLPAGAKSTRLFPGTSRNRNRNEKKHFLSRSGLTISLSFVVVLATEIGMLAAAAMMVKDLFAASEIHQSGIAGQRALQDPALPEEAELFARIEEDLKQTLSRRKDDAQGLSVLARIVEARFRTAVVNAIVVENKLPQERFQHLWNQFTPTALADHILRMDVDSSPASVARLKQTLSVELSEYPWMEYRRDCLDLQPLMPGVVVDLVAGEIARPMPSLNELLIHHAVFSDPADPKRIFQLGYFCIRQQQEDVAKNLWLHSVRISESMRGAILDEAPNWFTVEDVVRLFGPDHYEVTVATASVVRNQDVRQALWRNAELQWTALEDQASGSNTALILQLSPKVCLQRALHLEFRQQKTEATQWLEQCLAEFPEEIQLRVKRATLLEGQGDRSAALAEWLRVQHFAPDYPNLDRKIQALSKIE